MQLEDGFGHGPRRAVPHGGAFRWQLSRLMLIRGNTRLLGTEGRYFGHPVRLGAECAGLTRL
jgi:hypothetical protein